MKTVIVCLILTIVGLAGLALYQNNALKQVYDKAEQDSLNSEHTRLRGEYAAFNNGYTVCKNISMQVFLRYAFNNKLPVNIDSLEKEYTVIEEKQGIDFLKTKQDGEATVQISYTVPGSSIDLSVYD